MSNYIVYNDKMIPFPTPLVTLSQSNISYNHDWGADSIINLQGQLTGDYASIRSGQSGILDIFNKNFGSLKIFESVQNSSIVEYTGVDTYGNVPEEIEILDFHIANPYPVEFNVGLDFFAKDVKLYLHDMNHTYIRDIRAFLVSPDNKKMYLAFNADNGYGEDIIHADLIFSPYTNNLYGGLNSGTFKTAAATTIINNIYNFSEISSFPNIAVSNSMNIFSNQFISGKWKFYVEDLARADIGYINYAKLVFSGNNTNKIYEKSGIIINSITFDESHYNGILNYNIELRSINYSGNVTEPKNEFSFSENSDKTMNVNHSISARGINTNPSTSSSNAITNAINFVRNYTGLNNIPTVKFISGYNLVANNNQYIDLQNRFHLQNFSESIDRLNGVYSIEEQYRTDLLDMGYLTPGILNYSVNITSGVESNSIEINLRGSYKGKQYGDIENLRNYLFIATLITKSYSGYFNPIPIQYNISENTGENLINFDYSFDNIPLPNPYFKYSATTNRDSLDQICNVQVKGEMIARGNLAHRAYLLSGNIAKLTGQFISIASGALSGFKDFNNITTNSDLRLLNISIDRNDKQGKLSATANYDDKFLPTGSFKEASYSISVEAPRWYMNNQPTCNVYGFHIINDFDITTLPKLTINTNTITSNDSVISESVLRKNIENISKNIQPNNYNFDIKLQDSYNTSKKYSNLLNPYEISYTVNKTTKSNEVGLLPKFL